VKLVKERIRLAEEEADMGLWGAGSKESTHVLEKFKCFFPSVEPPLKGPCLW
jgi:hypothetical protein